MLANKRLTFEFEIFDGFQQNVPGKIFTGIVHLLIQMDVEFTETKKTS